MKRLFQKINFIFAQLSGFSLVFIIVFVLIDIVGRIMDKPVLGSSELAIFSMLIAVYLGMPYCEEQKEHVRVEVLLNIIPKNYRRRLEVLDSFIIFVSIGIVLYSLGKFTIHSFKAKTAIPGPANFRIFPVIFVMFVSILFFWIQTFINFLEMLMDSYKNSNYIQNRNRKKIIE